jgi:uncharacterized ferritin-like protein (DUF455 family)
MPDLFWCARQCLRASAIADKLRLTHDLAGDWASGTVDLSGCSLVEPFVQAGLPPHLRLVHPRQLPRRTLATKEGRAAMIHAVAHIEYNAINLAWDAVYRFRQLPEAYYGDWVRVAAEEARHFQMLSDRLEALGYAYGDFPGHHGLWDMARRTAHDPLARMAVVPRALEARGLDVTPGIIRRFREAGDQATCEVLEVILAEEVGHVAIGTRWFHHLCRERAMEPEPTYFEMLDRYMDGGVRGPLHRLARMEAGFSDSELEKLEAICSKPVS